MRDWRHGARTLAALCAAALAVPALALAAFPQDPPNDPLYDRAEDNPLQFCLDEEQWEHFDFLPRCALGASDPEGASGMSVNRAWREFTTGNPETVIAYVEAGVNWRDADAREIAGKTYLNAKELPAATTPDGDGSVLSVSDYSDSPDTNGNGLVDPEDLIVRFSNGADEDQNGYTDDISGWDFYTDTNNPATSDSAYEHANSQMERAGGETDNSYKTASVCPKCRLLPVKAGAEALDRTDELAQAWLFALDSGASVIVSVTADLGYSTFMRQVTERVAHEGAIAVEASNDFNSTDHQGGMWWPHVLPGNGLVADRTGSDQGTRLSRTYRERSNFTSWGAHNFLSAPSNGGTTSQATPTLGGAVALVMAYSREAAQQGKIARPLTGLEAAQVMRATASDVNDPNLSWPNGPGFDLQFGYGRPNVHRAMQAISEGKVPPVGTIEEPGWFTFFDPTAKQKTVPVTGHLEAPRSGPANWTLEMGLGAEPTDAEFKSIGRGSTAREFEGELGKIDLTKIPESFWRRKYELSKRKELETSERYTVTLRLRVTDAAGQVGEDRRAVAVHHDDTTVPGFPKRIGPGGEGQAALADLEGRRRLDIVFGDTDGRVHAIDPKTGREIRGFPVRTDPTKVERAHEGVDPGHEPIVNNVAVGDLDGNGQLSVVANTTTGQVYAWDTRGKRRRGFPRKLRTGVSAPVSPRPDLPFTRLPVQGAFAAPVLADLDGKLGLEIVQAGWDGRLHVYGRRGRELPGFPLEVRLPDSVKPREGYFRVEDHKLQGTPAIANLDGKGPPEIVVRSQYTDINDPGLATAPNGYLHAYFADGKPVPGWPVAMQGLIEDYGTAQEFITEGSNSPVAADVDGDGDDEVASNPAFSPSYLFDGNGSMRTTYGSTADAARDLAAGRSNPTGILAGDLPGDTPIGFTTSGAFGRFAGGLSFVQPGTGAGSIGTSLFLPGSGIPIRNYERAFDASSAAERPGFPAQLQGLNFLGAPLVADVTGDGEAEVLDGGDSSALHGFGADGAQAKDFPKFTTGWSLWSPSTGDLDSDGRTEVVQLTREGYLFAWRTAGRSDSNVEWWRWHHDERSSGRYGTDARPPGVVRRLKVRRNRLSFATTGDDWYAGRASRYRVKFTCRGRCRRARAEVRGPRTQRGRVTTKLPRGVRSVTIQAIDDQRNRGRLIAKKVRRRG